MWLSIILLINLLHCGKILSYSISSFDYLSFHCIIMLTYYTLTKYSSHSTSSWDYLSYYCSNHINLSGAMAKYSSYSTSSWDYPSYYCSNQINYWNIGKIFIISTSSCDYIKYQCSNPTWSCGTKKTKFPALKPEFLRRKCNSVVKHMISITILIYSMYCVRFSHLKKYFRYNILIQSLNISH